jgi:hypothetical protein
VQKTRHINFSTKEEPQPAIAAPPFMQQQQQQQQIHQSVLAGPQQQGELVVLVGFASRHHPERDAGVCALAACFAQGGTSALRQPLEVVLQLEQRLYER